MNYTYRENIRPLLITMRPFKYLHESPTTGPLMLIKEVVDHELNSFLTY